MMSATNATETALPNEEAAAVATTSTVEAGSSNDNSGGSGCCYNTKQFFLYDSSRTDIQAFYFNQLGRSILFISFMFLSLAILQLANEQAGCEQNENGSFESCGNKVYGMEPSSMLALMAVIGGIATSFFMPYAGAVVDFSDHRLTFGKWCAAILTLTNVIQIFIFESTWFAFVILQSVVASATFMANSMVMWSYLNAPDDHTLHGITSSGRLWETIGMLCFFIVIGAIQLGTGMDAVNLGRISQAVASTVGGFGLFMAYRRYQPVKAVKKLESGRNIFAAGFAELWETAKTLNGTDPSTARYLLASIFVDGGIGAVTTLAITYLSEQIKLGTTQIILFVLINFITNPIGVIGHRTLARKIGHKRNYLFSVAFILVVMSLLIGTIHQPEHADYAVIFSILIGVGYGWYYPSSNGYYVSIVPPDRVTELWGINSFCAVILSWVPPLIFTAFNESTGNLRLGLIGIIIFLFIGLLIGITIPVHGGVEESMRKSKIVEMVKSSSGDIEQGEELEKSTQPSPVED